MKFNFFSFIKQFIFRLILTLLGQYSIIEGIRAIDPRNSITEIIPLVPFTALFSAIINTGLFSFIVFAINRLSNFRARIWVPLSMFSGLYLQSIVLFYVLDGFFQSVLAYLFLFILPFLLIETILYFIRNRKIL